MIPPTTVVSPAAGPETLSGEPLSRETIKPPIMPDKMPVYNGAPEASAIPRHRGSATKKTVNPADRSCLKKSKP